MLAQIPPGMYRCFVLALLVGIATGTVGEDREGNKSKTRNTDAKAESNSPYSDYQSWKCVNAEPKAMTAKAMALCEPASRPGERADPHAGGFINVYVNQVGRDVYVKEKVPKFDIGSVIVKEKLRKKDGEEPRELGVMIKREAGFAPDAGDWQFLFVDHKGKVVDGKGMQKSCAACHRMRAKEDYVFQKVVTEAPSQGPNEEATSTKRTGNVRGP